MSFPGCRFLGFAIAVIGAVAVHGHGASAQQPNGKLTDGPSELQRPVVERTPRIDQMLAQNVIIRRNLPGQRPVAATGPEKPTFVGNRDLTRELALVKAKLAKGELQEAFSSLQRILDHPQDSFVRSNESASGYISLKEQAEKLLATVNSKGRESYELQFGHEARQQLNQAMAENDTSKMQELSRRYFLTKAGFEATYLLGCHYLDHAEPISAALCFERLLSHPVQSNKWQPVLSLKTAVSWARGGRAGRSAATLMKLKEGTHKDYLELPGRQISFFESKDDASAWLTEVLGPQKQPAIQPAEQWAIFRGDASRNAKSGDTVPIGDGVWTSVILTVAADTKPARSLTSQFLQTRLRELARLQNESNATTLPATHPLIVGDLIIFRTYRNLRAVSATTGQMLWETAVPDPAYRDLSLVLESSLSNTDEESNPSPAEQSMLKTVTDRFLKQRTWRDVTSGTLSSDGHAVFAIGETGVDGSFGNLTNNPFRDSFSTRGHNKLTAFEVGTGRFLWEIGGPSDREIEDHRGHYELSAAGSFFLGPPLPLKKLLFCLVETNGEIRLEARNPTSGTLDWEQPLIMPDLTILQNPLRRQSGISPAYADGIIVCPTTAGTIVAVNLDRRVLSWAYQYSTKVVPQTRTNPFALRVRGRIGRGYTTAIFDDESRWVDAVPTVAGGRVILTPRDSNELHCVNLDDGKLVWKRQRGEGMYVAAVYDGAVVVVGRSKLQAFSLDRGEPVWKHELPVPTPSGRGVRANHVYHLPLSTGEVASIDLRTGSLLARSRSRQHIPGNLVAANGTLVSQNPDTIVSYRRHDELVAQFTADLQRNPRDFSALALRGAVRLHVGRTESGLSDLKASLKIKPSAIAQRMVVDFLLEQLRIDFDRHRDAVGEIERLISDPRQQARFLRLYADGLTSSGERIDAFKAYLKLATLGAGIEVMERVDGSHFVRSDRRVQAVINSNYSRATPEERMLLDQLLQDRLGAAIVSKTPRPLQGIARFSPNEAIAISARQALVDRYVKAESSLELEFLSKRMTLSDDPAIERAASARLASLYLRNRKTQATPLIQRMATEWKDKLCLDNKTGGELVEEWSKLDDRLRLNQHQWPVERFQAERVERETQVERFYSIPFRGDDSSFPKGWHLLLDQQRQYVIARDGLSNERWRLKVANSPFSIPNSIGNYARVYGHLLVLTLGNRFVVLDTLTQHDADSKVDGSERRKHRSAPKVLWQRNLESESNGPGSAGSVRLQPMILPGGRRRFGIADHSGRPIGTVGIVTDDFICYQVTNRLFAAEPLTGKILWVKHDVPFGTEFFGDRKYVCVPDDSDDELTILRATDGATVGMRDRANADKRLRTIGRHELVVKITDGLQRISLFDPVEQKVVWQHDFDAKARSALIAEQELAVVEPTGKFRVLRTNSGQTMLEANLDPRHVASLDRIFVLRSMQHDVLLVNTRPEGRSPFRSNGINSQPVVHGHAFGFERSTSKKLWDAKLDGYGIDLNQPQELPILVFTNRQLRTARGANGRIITTGEYLISILDKRNGEFVYQAATKQSFNVYSYRVTLETNRISVSFDDFAIELSLAGEKPPAGDSKEPDKKSKAKKRDEKKKDETR